MKRIRLLVLLCTFAIALPIGLGTVGASGSSGGSSASISIQSKAQYDDAGLTLHVGTWVRCSGGLGLVQVEVDQGPPETTTPTHGVGGEDVVCNGSLQEVPVDIVGVRFGGGPAKAKATVIPPSGKSASTTKTITITAQRG
jgi:hypothetical protein